jgi:hypothetical protein
MRQPCCRFVCVPTPPNVARTARQNHSRGNEYKRNSSTVGRSVSYVTCDISDTQYLVKEKKAISSSKNFLLTILKNSATSWLVATNSLRNHALEYMVMPSGTIN